MTTYAYVRGNWAVRITHHFSSSACGRLVDAIQACECSALPSRGLDALIALAVFPELMKLPRLGDAIWRAADGMRVRALRYSASWGAATTLVPAGCSIKLCEGGVAVVGADQEWTGVHANPALSVCLAALRARTEPFCIASEHT